MATRMAKLDDGAGVIGIRAGGHRTVAVGWVGGVVVQLGKTVQGQRVHGVAHLVDGVVGGGIFGIGLQDESVEAGARPEAERLCLGAAEKVFHLVDS